MWVEWQKVPRSLCQKVSELVTLFSLIQVKRDTGRSKSQFTEFLYVETNTVTPGVVRQDKTTVCGVGTRCYRDEILRT